MRYDREGKEGVDGNGRVITARSDTNMKLFLNGYSKPKHKPFTREIGCQLGPG
jgi:hypothetical protein